MPAKIGGRPGVECRVASDTPIEIVVSRTAPDGIVATETLNEVISGSTGDDVADVLAKVEGARCFSTGCDVLHQPEVRIKDDDRIWAHQWIETGLRKTRESGKTERDVVSVVIKRMLTIVIAGHIFGRCNDEIVSARHKIGISIQSLEDRVVFESKIKDMTCLSHNRRSERDEGGSCKTATELGSGDFGQLVRGSAAQARACKGEA